MKYYQLSFTLDKSVRGKFEMPHTISIESPNFLKYISEKSKNFNCSSLTGVDIPNSVTNIYNCVFSNCIYNHRTTKTNQKYPSVNL